MEREGVVNTLIISTNGVRKNRPDGVTNVVLESKRGLLGRTIDGREMDVKIGGPRIPDKENNLADFTFGRRARLPRMNNTHFEASILYTGKPKARKFLEKEEPDLVIVHNPLAGNVMHSAMTADKKGKICFVGYFHAYTETLDMPSKFFHLVSRLRVPGVTAGFKNTVNKRLDGRVAVSRAAGEFWERILPGGDYEIIYNGVDTQRFQPGETVEKWRPTGKEKIVFAAARFDERKGLDILLQAINILVFDYNERDIRLKLAGDGKMRNTLEALRIRLGLKDYVEFLGIVSPESLEEAYRTADVFTSPVLGGEAFGLTLAEAMASGTLVVGSNVPGYNEVIGGNLPFAFLAKPGDPKDLAENLKRVLDLDPQERRNRGKLARKHVRDNFSLSQNINKQAFYYESCLRKRAAKVAEQQRKYSVPSIPPKGDVFVR